MLKLLPSSLSIMKNPVVALFFGSMILGCASIATGQRLTASYTVSFVEDTAEDVRVNLLLSGFLNPTNLRLPVGSTYIRLDEPRLRDGVHLQHAGEGGTSLERLEPYAWRLDPGTLCSVQLSWVVPLDHRRLPEVSGRDEYEFGYRAEEHGMLSASALFLAPSFLDQIEVEFNMPADWEVHAPWPSLDKRKFSPSSVEALQDDLIAVGDWDVVHATVADLKLTIALAPGQNALLQSAPAVIEEIVAAELELFGTTPQSKYLFVFGRPDMPGYGGSPKVSSMTLTVDPNLPLDIAMDGLSHLIAHEFHHTWGRARCRLPDELRFFTEGFTDYYAWVVPWRTGAYDDAKALQKLNRALADYEQTQSSLRLNLIEAGGPAFFERLDASAAVYNGGRMIAFLCDIRIRAAGEGLNLDELMRRFYEDPRWREGQEPVLEDLLFLLSEFADEAFSAQVRGWLTSPDVLDVITALESLDIAAERHARLSPPTPRATCEGATMVALDPTGSASLVGVRAGDRLIEVNGTPVETEGELRFAWKPGENDRIDLWLLRGEEELHIDAAWPQQVEYQLPADVLDRLR